RDLIRLTDRRFSKKEEELTAQVQPAGNLLLPLEIRSQSFAHLGLVSAKLLFELDIAEQGYRVRTFAKFPHGLDSSRAILCTPSTTSQVDFSLPLLDRAIQIVILEIV